MAQIRSIVDVVPSISPVSFVTYRMYRVEHDNFVREIQVLNLEKRYHFIGRFFHLQFE